MPINSPQLLAAIHSARTRILASGHGDLIEEGLNVEVWTDERIHHECRPNDQNWIGKYIPYSVESEFGLTCLLAVDRHEDWIQAADTIVHECGHGLWELIDADGQAAWISGVPDDPLETFANDFMWLAYQPYLMKYPDLFRQITAVAGAV